MKKEDGRKIPREAMEYMRIQSIKLWKEKKEIKDIAEFFGVTLDAVYKWIRKYKAKGLKALKRRKAPGAKPKLSEKEIKKLIKLLQKPADLYGFDNQLWDCKKVRQFIIEKFEKKIDVTNVWRLLIKLGFSYQKPEKEALERDDKQVKRWIKEEWPKIKEHRRRWQAMLYFQDESSISLTPVLGKTWSEKGRIPKVKVTGKRGSLCVTSAISPAGKMVFRIEKEKEKINFKKHIEFLKQILMRHPNRKIIIIEDNARPHIAKEVKNFVEQNKKRFSIYYIPRYSPELNPHEQVWKYLKHVKLKVHQAKNTKELKPLIKNNMISIRNKKGLVKSFFYGCVLY